MTMLKCVKNWKKLTGNRYTHTLMLMLLGVLSRISLPQYSTDTHLSLKNEWKIVSAPGLSSEIRQQMNNRDKAMRKARKTNNKTDWHFYKTLRNRCTNSIREAKTNCNKNLLAKNSNNPSRFWKIIKEIIPVKCKNATSRPLFVEADSKKSLIPLNFKYILFLFHKCYFNTAFTQILFLV